MNNLIGGWLFFGTQELWILLGILIVIATRHSLLAWMRHRRQLMSTEADHDDAVAHVTGDGEQQVTSR
jgi:hypothetical protein